MIRVFPKRTDWTPTDEFAFVGDPPLFPVFSPKFSRVRISVTFTKDISEGERLFRAWSNIYQDVQIGGPAFDDPGNDFIPGRFIKMGVVITSRGCIRKCPFCFVPSREGKIRELPIKGGWIIQDNNLLACSRPHIESVFEMLRQQPKPISFPGGLDARLLRKWHVELIKSIRLETLFVACDSQQAIKPLAVAANLLADLPQNKKHCYALIGYGDDTIVDAEKRLRVIYEMGFLPFAMLFDADHKNKDWKQFQRTWTRPAAYKTLMKKEKPCELPRNPQKSLLA